MSEPHNFLQNSASLVAASTSASSELPTVGSILAQRRSLRSKASHSPPSLRALVTTLASVAAIVVLVLYCWRGYKRRALQNLGSRKLASSEDTDAPDDVCGNSGDEKEQKEHQGPHLPRPSGSDGNSGDEKEQKEHQGPHLPRPSGSEKSKAPLKKRLLARSGGGGVGGGVSNPQQQEKEQHRHEPSGSPLDISQLEVSARAEGIDGSVLPVRSPPSSSPLLRPTEHDGATELLNSPPFQLDARKFASAAMTASSVEVGELERNLRRLKRRLQRNRWQYQQELLHLQQQQDNDAMRMQQEMNFYWQSEHWHYVLWQQQQQQQALLQQHGQQRFLQQQHPQQGLLQGMQQELQQELQQQEAREQQYAGKKRKRRHEEEPDKTKELQHRLSQPADPPSGLSPDEWIDPGSPRPEEAHPKTSQQALQSSASGAAGPSSPSTPMGFSTQVIPELPLASVAASAAPPALGAPPAGAAGAAAWRERHTDGLPCAASNRAEERASLEVPVLSRLLALGKPRNIQTAAAQRSDSAKETILSTPAMMGPPHKLNSPEDHPFVRLPRTVTSTTLPGLMVDLRGAVNSSCGMREVVPLLRKAYELLSRSILLPGHMLELSQITKFLMMHAMHHQHTDLSQHQSSHAVVRLGVRFLVLNAVVSGLMVLGQVPDDELWGRFTAAISHAAPARPESNSGRPNLSLSRAQILSKALALLKTGKRPEPAELLKIKDMLFCLPSSPEFFKKDRFDQWRKDWC
ncbi:hypothetical protein EPH_0004930 [Eimeria praecox]|uniref:Uncharacterized protein n=1 Tax=Eimeria praecox TaxID=51316 RepID=U6G557_9EIME|nr:hypothetical protein EPH_0004930 [Eimeria praecox]